MVCPKQYDNYYKYATELIFRNVSDWCRCIIHVYSIYNTEEKNLNTLYRTGIYLISCVWDIQINELTLLDKRGISNKNKFKLKSIYCIHRRGLFDLYGHVQ